MTIHKRKQFFLLITVLLVAPLFFIAPIPQDQNYHDFSDQRMLLGIPHFWNVISNLPFVFVGLWGAAKVMRWHQDTPSRSLLGFSLVFFIGFTLTGLGSAWYHLNPNNETLVWDRLPMTIAFMAFFSMMLFIHVDQKLGNILMFPLILLGAFSVFYWAYTEHLGRGDLRMYAAVQFVPIVLIPVLIILLPNKYYPIKYLIFLIVAYLSAKIFEQFDAEIHSITPLAGHAIKHVSASFAGVAFYLLVSCYVGKKGDSSA